MAIPNSINDKMPSYVHGEVVFATPLVAYAGLFNSTNEADNGIGKVYTHKTDGTFQAGGNGKFAGISINPKAYNIDLPFNGRQGEFARRAEIGLVIEAPSTVAIGDKLYYKADGEITANKDNGKTAGDKVEYKEIPNCLVARNVPLYDADEEKATLVASILN